MGLFQALKNTLRGASKKAEEKLADPARDAEFAIEDSEKELKKYKANVAQAMGSLTLLKKERDSIGVKIEQLGMIAEKTFNAGKEADATRALEEQSNLEAQAAELDKQISATEADLSTQRQLITKINSKISKAKSNLSINKAKMAGVQNRRAMNEAFSSFNHDNPLSKLDEFDKAVAKAEATADAEDELSSSSQSILEKYASEGPDVSDKLAALRAKKAGTTA